MQHLAIGGAAVGGIGGGVFVVVVAVSYLLRFLLLNSRRGQGYTSTRWPGGAPGGIGQQGADAAPKAPSPEEQKRREQAHAYWEAEEPPASTLPAEGFIGDDAEPVADDGRDQEPADQ